MKHVIAPLAGFETAPAIEAMLAELHPHHARRPIRKFPVRYLRYWFMRHALVTLHARAGRPLKVLEVGIGDGKMPAFLDGARRDDGTQALAPFIGRWDAISAKADPRTLKRFSYSSFHEVNLDTPFALPAHDYDAVIALHVLEHLKDPEATMRALLPALRDGGLLMGGTPTMPEPLGRIHERQLRQKFADLMDDIKVHRHLSVITPGRIRRFAREQQLAVDLLAGAFLVRSSASPLEDCTWWLRMNLAWGALFPALGGELYFALEKTARSGARVGSRHAA